MRVPPWHAGGPPRRGLASIAGLALLAPLPQAQAGDGPRAASFSEEIQPILEQYCYACHGLGTKKGDVALDAFPDEAAARGVPKLWLAALKNMRSGIMPPADKSQPTAEERQKLEDWIKYG